MWIPTPKGILNLWSLRNVETANTWGRSVQSGLIFLGTKTVAKNVMEDLTCKYLWMKEEFCALIQWMMRRHWWKIWSKSLIKSELGLKLVLNSILTKSQKILCFVWGLYSPEGSPQQRKWNKDEQRTSQKPGSEKVLRDKSMLWRMQFAFVFVLTPRTLLVLLVFLKLTL